MKRTKNLIIMASVLAVLVAGYFAVTALTKDPDVPTDETAAQTYSVGEIDHNALCSVSVTNIRDGETETLNFRLGDAGECWIWDGNEELPLDNSKFVALVSAVSEAVSDYKMNVETAKLGDYGLDAPASSVTFGFDDGKTVTYIVGDRNSFNGKYYFADAADVNSVYVVDSTVALAPDVTVLDMILFDEIPTLTAASVKAVSWQNGSDTLKYTRYSAGNPDYYTDYYSWFLSVNGGKERPVSPDFAGKLENMLEGMFLTECVSYDRADEAKFGMDHPVAVTVDYVVTDTVEDSETGLKTDIDRDEKLVLEFGGTAEDGTRYARPEGSAMIYGMFGSEFVTELLSAGEITVLPAEIVTLNVDQITSLKATSGDKTLSVNITHGADTDVYKHDDGTELTEKEYNAFGEFLAAINDVRAVSDTSLVGKTAEEEKEIFRLELGFVNEKCPSGTLVITEYGGNYCRVSFLDRDSQLVPVDVISALIAMIG